jgi:hypothetical protein
MPTVVGCAAAFAGRAERSSQCNCGWAARRVATDPQQLGAALATIAGGSHAPSGGVVRRVSGAGSESVRPFARCALHERAHGRGGRSVFVRNRSAVRKSCLLLRRASSWASIRTLSARCSSRSGCAQGPSDTRPSRRALHASACSWRHWCRHLPLTEKSSVEVRLCVAWLASGEKNPSITAGSRAG